MCGLSLRCVCVAPVPRIGEHSRAICSLGPVAAVAAAGVAHEHRLLLDNVTPLAMSSAGIDGVLVIETPADRVAFDDLIAHLGCDSELLAGE